ncbi:hypothetical protein OOZ19_22565 [Saccharopolyspora sp. NFXS83]|uniref:hypothetical protein n=1 Tax=Saccharopolyspora sp. NFXS83 TaxID=2993560 RepID=UPI00224A812F|nr:hypothetical protein [Saccharopolyspora sp. NFXS83]MCX2733033.1 hypothetical protein [Saccharopolyspora sp. NFXS83]
MNAKTTSMVIIAGALVFPHVAEGGTPGLAGGSAIVSESALGFGAQDGNGNGWRMTNAV